jgi:hypothetical protein
VASGLLNLIHAEITKEFDRLESYIAELERPSSASAGSHPGTTNTPERNRTSPRSCPGSAALLQDTIAAIQVVHVEPARKESGFIAEIPRGAMIALCGDGFNERTVEVAWEGRFYFVYVRDLESSVPGLASARDVIWDHP